MYTDKEVGSRLRRIREDDNVSKEELAKLLMITVEVYSNYEEGIIPIPVTIVMQLADYYDVSLDFMVGRGAYKNKYRYSF